MSIATYIVLSIAFAIATMLLMRRCAETTPVKLTKGIAIMLVTALIYVILFVIGVSLGDLLRFEGADAPELYARTNAYIFLGLTLFVALRMLLPYLKRNPQLPIFDLRKWGGVAAMSVASGINVMLVGLGLGFVTPLTGHIHWAIWPLFISTTLLGYMGIMFGRQKVTIRPRRWMIIACILLLGCGIAAVVNS